MAQQLNFTHAFVVPFCNVHLQQDNIHQHNTPSNTKSILDGRLKAGAAGTTSTWSRNFQIWPSAAKGRELKKPTSPAMAKPNRRAAAEVGAPEGGFKCWLQIQLWCYWVHLPPEQPWLPSLGENMTLHYTGLLWGREAAYPLIHSGCGHIPGPTLPMCARIAPGFHQPAGRGTDSAPNNHAKSDLRILWA